MNKLEIYLSEELYADWRPEKILTIGFKIDGKELNDWVKDAGINKWGYTKAIASDLLPPHRDLIGEPHIDWFDDGKTILMTCSCREIGCNPLAVHITISDAVVKWDDFSDPGMDIPTALLTMTSFPVRL